MYGTIMERGITTIVLGIHVRFKSQQDYGDLQISMPF